MKPIAFHLAVWCRGRPLCALISVVEGKQLTAEKLPAPLVNSAKRQYSLRLHWIKRDRHVQERALPCNLARGILSEGSTSARLQRT